jgi:hypothetical protein
VSCPRALLGNVECLSRISSWPDFIALPHKDDARCLTVPIGLRRLKASCRVSCNAAAAPRQVFWDRLLCDTDVCMHRSKLKQQNDVDGARHVAASLDNLSKANLKVSHKV